MPILDKPQTDVYKVTRWLNEHSVVQAANLRPAHHGRVRSYERRLRIERQQAHRMLEMSLIKEYERTWGPVPYSDAAFAFVHAELTVAGSLVVRIAT